TLRLHWFWFRFMWWFHRGGAMRLHVMGSVVVLACCAMASARTVCAQETINYASLSGRVTDAQGAVVPGAQVSAPDGYERHIRNGDGCGRTLSIPVSQGRTVRSEGASRGIRGEHARGGSHDRLGGRRAAQARSGRGRNRKPRN